LFERKLWNRDFGTEIPIPQLPFKRQAYKKIWTTALTSTYNRQRRGRFFKASCGIGVSVPKFLFHNFVSKTTIEDNKDNGYGIDMKLAKKGFCF
jgi:hypothetical protein